MHMLWIGTRKLEDDDALIALQMYIGNQTSVKEKKRKEKKRKEKKIYTIRRHNGSLYT